VKAQGIFSSNANAILLINILVLWQQLTAINNEKPGLSSS
jgi:hypothetical protein